jgi:hypothetical protein
MSLKPKGLCKAVELIADEPHKFSVTATVVCVDEDGNKFSFEANYFSSELKPYNPNQGMIFYDWDRKRRLYIESHQHRWRASDKESDLNYRMQLYLGGRAFDDVPELETTRW